MACVKAEWSPSGSRSITRPLTSGQASMTTKKKANGCLLITEESDGLTGTEVNRTERDVRIASTCTSATRNGMTLTAIGKCISPARGLSGWDLVVLSDARKDGFPEAVDV